MKSYHFAIVMLLLAARSLVAEEQGGLQTLSSVAVEALAVARANAMQLDSRFKKGNTR